MQPEANLNLGSLRRTRNRDFEDICKVLQQKEAEIKALQHQVICV